MRDLKSERIGIRISGTEKNIIKDLGINAADLFHEALAERSKASDRRRAISDRIMMLLSMRSSVSRPELLKHFDTVPEHLLNDAIAELSADGKLIETITYKKGLSLEVVPPGP